MTEITCKSYATYSILFQGHFYTVNTTCRNKLNLCRNEYYEIDPLYSKKIAL